MCTVAVAKAWKPPECPSTDKEIKKNTCAHVHTHSPTAERGLLFRHKRERNPAFCNNMMDPRGTMVSERGQTKTDMISLAYGSNFGTDRNRELTSGYWGSRDGRNARCWSKGTNSVIRFVAGVQSQWVTTLNNTVWYT